MLFGDSRKAEEVMKQERGFRSGSMWQINSWLCVVGLDHDTTFGYKVVFQVPD